MNKLISQIFVSSSLLIMGTALGVWGSRQLATLNQSSVSDTIPPLKHPFNPLLILFFLLLNNLHLKNKVILISSQK